MNHICLRIEGEYWDYLIKYNYLYLWTFNDELVIYNWAKLVGLLKDKYPELKGMNVFIHENEFLGLNLPGQDSVDISISHELLEKCLINHNEFYGFTSIDSYNELLIVNDDNGIQTLSLFDLLDSSKNSIHCKKISDLPCFDVQNGKHGNTVMAAGEEGIHYCNFNRKVDKPKLKKINENQSNKVGWIKGNIYSTSPIANNFFFDFQRKNEYDSNTIFKNNNVQKVVEKPTWSSNNKIYKVISNNTLEEVNIILNKNKEIEFRSKKIEFMDWKGEIITGKGTSFGTVVECKHALVVIYRDGSYLNISGDLIKWKVDTKNNSGKNILGVIYDDFIKFYGFH